jgi:hypothetical protein
MVYNGRIMPYLEVYTNHTLPQELTSILQRAGSEVFKVPEDGMVPVYLPGMENGENAPDVMVEIKPSRTAERERAADVLVNAFVDSVLSLAKEQGVEIGSVSALLCFVDGWSGPPRS